MPRKPTGARQGHKVRLSITLAPDLYEWLLEQTRSRRFANMSHAIEFALQTVRDRKPPGT